ncbi:uncharacterized protein LOC134536457 [Bacillus rossius redtenbacheri]|uniref:uncharacterized protein LOC134536457 n=1 Tax=Bacillus rossius redtenbacheri TaxID=93214 RepID=UPI002FDDDFEF
MDGDWSAVPAEGPPPVTGLRLAQSSRELAALEWTPRPEGSCASGVELWLCDNSTQDPAACVHKTLLAGSSRFEFHGFEVCRRYHATVRATSGFRLSPPATLEVYLDTANAVARAEVRYVTHDSAVIEWWVSDVKSRCQEETMRVCVQEEGVGETPPDCWEWTLDQDGPRDSLAVGDLEPCAAYAATVSLIAAGRHSNKTVAFTTPMTAEALSATTEHVTNTAAEIRWSYDVSSSDCRPSVVRVCYSKLGSGDHRKMCRTSGTASRSSMHLADLLPCSSYNVSLVLITSVGPRPNCTLPLVTTSQGVPVLRSLDVTAAGRNVTVRWTPMGADLHCVRHYNVSWWSVPGFGRAHRTLEAGVTSLAIPGPLRRAAYHVEVTAVLTDGSSQALPGNFSTADSASMFAKFSLHLEMMPLIIVLLTLFQQ